jgi:hypothetical protein
MKFRAIVVVSHTSRASTGSADTMSAASAARPWVTGDLDMRGSANRIG